MNTTESEHTWTRGKMTHFWASASRCFWSLPRVCLVNNAPSILMATCIVSHRPVCVCVNAFLCVCLSCKNSCKSISGHWKKLSTGIPEGKWDIQCMISIKWSLSCSSSDEILYLCLRLLWLLDITLKSCVTLYLLLTDDMTAGWPHHRQGCVSQYAQCAYVSAACVCVDGFRDAEPYNVDHRASNCSRTAIAVPQSLEKGQPVKNVITLLNYFIRLAYSTLCLNDYPLTQLVHFIWVASMAGTLLSAIPQM